MAGRDTSTNLVLLNRLNRDTPRVICARINVVG